MHAKLVKIRQCKGFYFGMGIIELSMKNIFLHKYIYRVCYVWKFYDQFFNDILSIIIKIFSKYVGPNWMLHSLKGRPVQNQKSNQFFSPQLEIHFFNIFHKNVHISDLPGKFTLKSHFSRGKDAHGNSTTP